MRNEIRKGLVVAIILLFIGVAVAPSINANIDRRLSETVTNSIVDEIVEVTVSQHKADGTVEKTFIEITKSKVLELEEKLKQIQSSKETFTLLKEYDLILQDVTLEQLQLEMLDVAERLGVTEEKVASTFKKPMCKIYGRGRFYWGINFFNTLRGISLISFNLPIGLSFFIGLLNYVIIFNAGEFVLPSADLFYTTAFGLGEYWFNNGTLSDFGLASMGIFALGGFVGYTISFPFFSPINIMVGFSVVSFGFSINPYEMNLT